MKKARVQVDLEVTIMAVVFEEGVLKDRIKIFELIEGLRRGKLLQLIELITNIRAFTVSDFEEEVAD
jgi:hypothetical protein